MPAVTEPALRRVAHVRGRRGVDPLQVPLDEQRITGVKLALRQDHRLAAEAADLLEPAHGRGVDRGDRAPQLVRCRTAGAERVDDGVDGLGGDLGRLAGIEGDGEVGDAGDLERGDAEVH